MPPFLALALTFFLILYAFALEHRRNTDVSNALWIPFLWIALIGTRFASQWLNLGAAAQAENLLDQIVFLALYACAALVLIRRRISIRAFMANNRWLALFLIYCLLSVLWSDYPWTALKRWIKVTEHVAMVLVVLSEPNVGQAIDALLRRFSYLALALSVCFMKYFPEISRGFDQWTGEAINLGVTTDKNALGHICVISGMFLASVLLAKELGRGGKQLLYLDVLMAAFTVWLLTIADAKTALVCFLVGVLVIILVTKTAVGKTPRRVLVSLVLGVALFGLLEATFDLRAHVIEMLGRDATLTDRTLVWEDVLAVKNNPIVGTGFESFWLGAREEALWAKYWWRPNQAHNGLIETYINLGVLGVLLLVGAIAAAFYKTLNSLASDPVYGPMRLALLIAILFFNYTDATFKAVHVLYFLFFLIAIDYPERASLVERGRRAQAGEPAGFPARLSSVAQHPASFSASRLVKK